MTRAEALALSLLSALVTSVVLPYTADLLGFGVVPRVTAVVSLMVAVTIVAGQQHVRDAAVVRTLARRWSGPPVC